ncbi:MAG: RNA methyltransferase [Desulfobacteraceae bacterium]|nr:RNA methyltransferase [Desulfobacteraceae bacterium]
MKTTAFEKRIKRRIIGRFHTFFAVCPPGLRNLCKKELNALFKDNTTIKLLQGGVEFKGKLEDLYRANLNLRSPSRILMRIDRFKADHFSMLEKKIKAIDWELYLPFPCRLDFNVTCKKSRLYHSDAIAQRCEKIIAHKMGDLPAQQPGANQTIHIRVVHDEFEISLDTSGQPLFKRGIKEKVGKAPLRENLAFFILEAVQFTPKDILMDPMCGSGSFSIEAAMIKSNVPPGFFRTFAFENWPSFRPEKFNFIKKKLADNIHLPQTPGIFSFDQDSQAAKQLSQNIESYEFTSAIQVCQGNYFDIQPRHFTREKAVVVLNPPYGRRIGEKGQTFPLYREIGEKLKQDFKGWRAGVILPSKSLIKALGLKAQLKPFFHGGLELYTAVCKIP